MRLENPHRDELDRAFRFLDRHVPQKALAALRFLREPRYWWVRWPVGLLMMASSAFWFLPVIGIEFLPLGLLLIAQDVPFLRKPVGLVVIWCEFQSLRLWRWWRRRRRRSTPDGGHGWHPLF